MRRERRKSRNGYDKENKFNSHRELKSREREKPKSRGKQKEREFARHRDWNQIKKERGKGEKLTKIEGETRRKKESVQHRETKKIESGRESEKEGK